MNSVQLIFFPIENVYFFYKIQKYLNKAYDGQNIFVLEGSSNINQSEKRKRNHINLETARLKGCGKLMALLIE